MGSSHAVWRETGVYLFPLAATIDGIHHVLRRNGPGHPAFSELAGRRVLRHLAVAPDPQLRRIRAADRRPYFESVRGLARFGSESGSACSGECCGSVLQRWPAFGEFRGQWRWLNAHVFLFAAQADGAWWALRLNDFPDHPAYTLFIDGTRIDDIEDPRWLPWQHPVQATTMAERTRILDQLRGLGPYGSEIGQPCDGDYCTCDVLSDDHVRAWSPAPD